MSAIKFVMCLNAVLLVRAYTSNTVLFPTLPNVQFETDNSFCNADNKLYLKHLENKTLWAHEMWDSTAKSVEGILRGNVFQLGDFDECMTVRAPFSTQYCLVTVTANVPERYRVEDPFTLNHDPYGPVLHRIYDYQDVSQQTRHIVQSGWCVPASCQRKDLEQELNKYFITLDNTFANENVSYTARIEPTACQTQEQKEIDGSVIGFCVLTIVLVVLVITATVYDFQRNKHVEKTERRSFLYKSFMAFSAKKNFQGLAKAESSSLTILYGIRFICILLIINGHKFILYVTSPIINYDFLEREYRSEASAFLLQGHLIVDSFFTLSGILVTYSLLSKFDKVRANPIFIILWRYVRLTPVYAFVIFYYATAFDYIGTGPMWKMTVSQESLHCKNNWYLNLLYLNNYINDDKMCIIQSWYLPCDFHYFIIAIFICMAINKNKKFGLILLTVVTFATIIITFVVTVVYNSVGLMPLYTKLITDVRSNIDFRLKYTKSHTRATPYFVGMYAGYIYYKMGNCQKYWFTRTYAVIAVSIVLMVASMFSGSVFYDPYHPFNPIESGAYASLTRGAWGMGTIGLLFAASHGHASFVSKILSWSPWIPLSKLSYSAFLIHMQFQLRNIGMLPAPIIFDYLGVISGTVSDWVMGFSSALLLYLAVEEPFKIIFKELLMPSKTPTTTSHKPPYPEMQFTECKSITEVSKL